MAYLLGIDVGTSGTKAALFTPQGETLATVTVEYSLSQPQNGWAEQNPTDWWVAVCTGIKRIITSLRLDPAEIKGIGLAGQMHGLVMLDREGEVLRPAIIWCDQRTTRETEELAERIGSERIISLTANPAMFSFTAARVLWVQRHEPHLYECCAHILLPKDYIRFKLTGEFATEVSDASGMQLMDVAKRCWSAEILDKLGISQEQLGVLRESQEVTGKVHATAALETGLAEGTIVVGGAADNAAAAIGMGVIQPDSALATLGSSGVILALSDELVIDYQGRIHSLCAAVPGKWTVMSCTQAAGLSLKWFRDQFCQDLITTGLQENTDPYRLMDCLAAEVEPGALGLIFLPYLMGERSPHPDPDCRGVFFGLSAMHTRGHLIRAVMEGVAFSQKECVDVFAQLGIALQELRVCGGGYRSLLWRQMLADLCACRVTLSEANEGPALGAAILASVGAGIYRDLEQACEQMVRPGASITGSLQNQIAYQSSYDLYRNLYPALAGSFTELSRL